MSDVGGCVCWCFFTTFDDRLCPTRCCMLVFEGGKLPINGFLVDKSLSEKIRKKRKMRGKEKGLK